MMSSVGDPIQKALPGPSFGELQAALGKLLSEYREQQLDPSAEPSSEWVRRLFHLIGWGDTGPARMQALAQVEDAEILECEIFGFPAFHVAAFPPSPVASWAERTEAALTWLYNRGDEWVVASDFEHLEIFNVRWTDLDHSYVAFRSLELTTYRAQAETLALLTPSRIHQRDLFEQGEAEAPKVRFDKAKPGQLTVRPQIETAILDAIQRSRSDFLHAPPPGDVDAQTYDEQVHQLLLRLIFVRACEDMGLQIARPLSELLDHPDIHEGIDAVLASYRSLYESELFATLDLHQFDPATLRSTIDRLYVFAHVIRFNFAAVEADVLGIMYEEYLKYRAVKKERVSEGGQQIYFFVLERIGTENVKRREGIYYTPSFLVEAIVERSFELMEADQGWISGRPLVVADLACGSGTFLASAFRRIGKRPTTYSQAADVLQASILGVDRDRRAVEATRLNLWLTLFRLHPEVHPLPYLSRSVFDRDALIGPLLTDADANRDLLDARDNVRPEVARLPAQPDLVVGNPPFVALERQEHAYRQLLREEGFETLTGRADLSNLFVERALETVRPGGIVALVVPNRIFTTESAASLRSLLRERARLEQIIDFGTLQIFDATTYVSVIFLRRLIHPEDQGTVPTVIFDNLVPPFELHVREALHALAPPPGARRRNVVLPEGDGPVFFLSHRVADVLTKMRADGVPLEQVAVSRQGIRLGDQAVYLLEEVSVGRDASPGRIFGQSFGKIAGHEHVVVEIERAVLRPAVHSQAIRRYKEPGSPLWLIYPYDEDGKLIPFDEFSRLYPGASEYLRASRERLRRRARVSDHTWHKLAEPRQQAWLAAPKILIPQLAQHGRMTLDREGLYLVQGYGLLPRSSLTLPLEGLLVALNSTPLVWALAMSSPHYRGQHFEYQGKNINSIPVPRRLLMDETFTRSITDLGTRLLEAYRMRERSEAEIARLETEADGLVFAAMGLTSREVAVVEEESAAYRPHFSWESLQVARRDFMYNLSVGRVA